MIDVGAAIRQYLLAQGDLTALVGPRIYAESDSPPPGYKPGADGPAVCFKVRGGRQDYSDVLLLPSVQVKVYADTTLHAQETYRALYDALHNRHDATMRWAQSETLGVTLLEPETSWVFVLVYFQVWIANE